MLSPRTVVMGSGYVTTVTLAGGTSEVEVEIEVEIETDPALFSPRRLDRGTRHLIESTTFAAGEKVLDLGCGAGVVGIVAAKLGATVTALDSDAKAVAFTKANAARNGVEIEVVKSDGFRQLRTSGFDQILVNPPYHADFAVPKHFIEKGFNRLVIGGSMRLVTQRQRWYRRKLAAIFGGVRELDFSPYTVFVAERRQASYATHKRTGRNR